MQIFCPNNDFFKIEGLLGRHTFLVILIEIKTTSQKFLGGTKSPLFNISRKNISQCMIEENNITFGIGQNKSIGNTINGSNQFCLLLLKLKPAFTGLVSGFHKLGSSFNYFLLNNFFIFFLR